MLVSYLPLLFSALVFSQQIRLPLAIFIDSHCRYLSAYFYGITACVSARPSINASSSAQYGLLVGILLAVLMDNLIPWEASNNLLKKD